MRRREEPSWAGAIAAALSGAARVVNVGAGTGNYEPPWATLVAVEPAETMLAQRPASAAPAVRGAAEALPFADATFDVAMAVLTVHHWRDPDRGLRELARVAPRQVVVTWDPAVSAGIWLLRDYLPQLREVEASLPSLRHAARHLDVRAVEVLAVPRGCRDGFLGAGWEDPSRYLDPAVRASMSGLALLDQRGVDDALAHLGDDLRDGIWARRNAALDELDALDCGYRLVVAGASPGSAATRRPTP